MHPAAIALLILAALVTAASLVGWFVACRALDRACTDTAAGPLLLPQAHHVWYGATLAFLGVSLAQLGAALGLPALVWLGVVLAVLGALAAVDDALQHLAQLHDFDRLIREGIADAQARATAVAGELSPLHRLGHAFGWY